MSTSMSDELSHESISAKDNKESVQTSSGSQQETPPTAIVKRGPGRPRKFPLAPPNSPAISSSITASQKHVPQFQQTHEFYELQKLLMKEKMKKYAKKYVDKERRRQAQEYYSPPGYQQHPFAPADAEEEDEDVEDEYYADDESNHHASINRASLRSNVGTTSPQQQGQQQQQQQQDPRYQAKLSQILGRR